MPKNIAVIGRDGTVRLDNQGQSWTEMVVEDEADLVAIQLSPELARAMMDALAGYLQGRMLEDRL
jgi:hypothetical protein